MTFPTIVHRTVEVVVGLALALIAALMGLGYVLLLPAIGAGILFAVLAEMVARAAHHGRDFGRWFHNGNGQPTAR